MVAPEFMFLSEGSAPELAPRLLGCEFARTLDDQEAVVRIVEVEAYDQTDAASHSFRGKTPRTAAMFGPAGHLYVYFIYGMHYSMNVVVGPEDRGTGILIRAVEPVAGEELLQLNRPAAHGVNLTNGPGKLCQALDVDRSFNGHDLSAAPLQLRIRPALPVTDIVQTTRVGISQAQDQPWRFYIKGNPFVSKR
jgi:DNA-3-methyladenine glycosylase